MLNLLPPPSGAPAELEVRELTLAEIATTESVFKEAGASLPDPATSTFIGAIEGGKVVGFLVLQLRLHAEPMWIEPGKSQLFTQLVHAAEEAILRRAGPQYVYTFCPAGRVSQLAQSMGMQMEPWVVMSKLVMPEVPAKPALNLELPVDPAEPEPSFRDFSGEEPAPEQETIQ